MRAVASMMCAVIVTWSGCGKSDKGKDKAAPAPAAVAAKPAPPDPGPASAAGGNAPYVPGAGGKRVPAGYETSFTGPGGKVTIPYTHISGNELGPHGMQFLLQASASDAAGAMPTFSAILGAGQAKTVADLAGKTVDDFDAMKGRPLQIGLESGGGTATQASVQITAVTADAVEGTFTAEIHEGLMPDGKLLYKVTDGKFKAYPGQVVTKDMARGKGP